MTKPIGQTFFVSDAPGGAAGAYITAVDIYFKSVSTKYGIELQIRSTENGYPTPNRLPFGSSVVLPTDRWSDTKYIEFSQYGRNGFYPETYPLGRGLGGDDLYPPVLVASDDASQKTSFIFDTPVYVETGKAYAIVLIPVGGNPDFEVWTAKIGDQDVTHPQVSIYNNNDVGDLFISSNDITWAPILNEDMKFLIYCAKFTSNYGAAYFWSPEEERIYFEDKNGKFLTRENLAFGNGYVNNCVLTVGSVSGTFNVGDTVWQNISGANVVGKIYSWSSPTMKLSNTSGNFTAGALYDTQTSATATISAYSQNVVCTAVSNTISVPDGNYFTTGNFIYLSNKNETITEVFKITAKTSTTLQLHTNPSFNAIDGYIGYVYGNFNYNAKFSGFAKELDDTTLRASLDNANPNATYNLTSLTNDDARIIGLTSKASAKFIGTFDAEYNAITPNFLYTPVPNTTINFSFQGILNDGNYTIDPTAIPVVPGRVNELIDNERIFMSRSSEWTKFPTGRKGWRSFVIKTEFYSDNNKVSPIIDKQGTNLTYTYNYVANNSMLNGVYLSVNNHSNIISPGTIIYQDTFGNTVSGTVYESNSTYIMVNNLEGIFSPGKNYYFSNSVTGFVKDATKFSESFNNGYRYNSRYISKNVVLASGQDSEDIRVYLTSYRPANTDFAIYGKFINSADKGSFDKKNWTRLVEISPSSLQSSKVNVDDRVELVYGLPKSIELFTDSQRCRTDSLKLHVTSTEGISNGDFIYIGANTNVKRFNANTAVDNSTEFITLSYQNFANGAEILYTTAYGNTVLGGLANNTTYYVVQANTLGIKLSDTIGGSPKNITAVSTVASNGHYLTEQVQNFNVRKVVFVVNATAVTLDNYPTFTNSNNFVGIVPNIEAKSSAFLYDKNNYIARYVSNLGNGGIYDSYIQYAIKIVPLADSSSLVPRASDMRVLSLQI